MLHAGLVHYEHDHVGFRSTNQKTELAAGKPHGARCAPTDSACLATAEEALSIFSTDDKSAFFQVRDNDDTTGFAQQILWNSFV